jgi:hypothetical protein
MLDQQGVMVLAVSPLIQASSQKSTDVPCPTKIETEA